MGVVETNIGLANMGTYFKTKNLYPGGIKAKAIELGYSAENLCILDGDIVRLEREFPICYRNLVSCSHAADDRSMIEYAQDLVANWILEDIVVNNLKNAGLDIRLMGGDKERKLLNQRGVSSNSDCIVFHNGKSRHLEIVMNFTNYWERTGKMELRDSKYNKLVREKSLLLGILIKSRKCFIVDFQNPNMNVEYIPCHEPWGGKPANSVSLDGSFVEFRASTIRNILEKNI